MIYVALFFCLDMLAIAAILRCGRVHQRRKARAAAAEALADACRVCGSTLFFPYPNNRVSVASAGLLVPVMEVSSLTNSAPAAEVRNTNAAGALLSQSNSIAEPPCRLFMENSGE